MSAQLGKKWGRTSPLMRLSNRATAQSVPTQAPQQGPPLCWHPEACCEGWPAWRGLRANQRPLSPPIKQRSGPSTNTVQVSMPVPHHHLARHPSPAGTPARGAPMVGSSSVERHGERQPAGTCQPWASGRARVWHVACSPFHPYSSSLARAHPSPSISLSRPWAAGS